MPGMGGGGSGGGSIVQQTRPWAAAQAGLIGSQAAQEASDLVTKQMNNAINSINRQYQQARYDVQPYRTAGVQALDQLNQYMGLSAYNPGAAPTAPTAPTLDTLGKEISRSALMNYVINNSTTNRKSPGEDQAQGYIYNGVGSGNGPVLWGDMGPQEVLNPSGPYADLIRKELAGQMLPDAERAYQTDLQGYNQNLAEYNQNKAWYDQYSAEGPLTSQQVSDRITNLPGYQAQLDQGTAAIGANASARGYLGSGRLMKELSSYGQNTLSQFYGNELSRLAGIAGQGYNAASQTSQNSANQGNALGSLYQSLGENQAGARLAGGSAMSNAMTAANQQFSVMGGGGGGGMGGFGSLLGGIGGLIGSKASGASGLMAFL